MGNDKNELGKFSSLGRDKGAKRGDNKLGYLAQRRAERNANRGLDTTVEWGSAEAGKVLSLISAVTGRGCTITFAVTRDGNALKCTLYDGSEQYHEYCRSSEEIETYLLALLELFA